MELMKTILTPVLYLLAGGLLGYLSMRMYDPQWILENTTAEARGWLEKLHMMLGMAVSAVCYFLLMIDTMPEEER